MGEQRVCEWLPDCVFGAGFDSRYFKTRGACLDHVPDEGVVGTGSIISSKIKSSYKLRLIDSSSELIQELGVSASAAVQTPSVNITTSASFAREHACDQNSVYLLGTIIAEAAPVTMSATQLENLSLPPDLLALITTKPVEFMKNFGDCFISGWVGGAALHILFTMTSHSLSDKTSLSVSVKGGGGAFSGAAELKGRMDSISKNRDVSIDAFATGGIHLDWSKMTVDAALENMDKFEAAIYSDGGTFRQSAILTPYRELRSLVNVSFGDLDGLLSEIDNLCQAKLHVMDTGAALDYVKKYGNQFPQVGDPASLRADSDKVDGAKEYLDSEVSRLQSLSALQVAPRTYKQILAEPKVMPAETVRNSLPPRLEKLPATAEDIRAIFQNPTTKADPPQGVYTIFPAIGGWPSGVDLYCTFPKNGPAKSYIELVSTATGANTSMWPVSNHNGYWRGGSYLLTVYSKIAFDPRTGIVDLHDATFATTTPASAELVDYNAKPYSVQARYHVAPYGIASSSNNDNGNRNRDPPGTANIDLRGTAFQIDPKVVWTLTGWGLVGYPHLVTPSDANNHQLAEMTARGAPGTSAPVGDLILRAFNKP